MRAKYVYLLEDNKVLHEDSLRPCRFGRYALDISLINKRLGGLKNCEERISSCVKDMGEKVLEMVRLSIESLKSHNAQIAGKNIRK